MLSGTASGVALDFENFVPTVNVNLGAVSLPLALDTGDASTVELASDFAGQHATVAAATTVRIGAASLEGGHISTTGRIAAPDRGVVGSGYFAHFVTTFDYAHGRMTLVPRAGDADAKTAAP